MIHLPSVRALARDIAKAAALGTVVAAVADWYAERVLVENHRLRAKNRELEMEVARLSQANLRPPLSITVARVELVSLDEAEEVSVTDLVDDLAELDGTDTLGDILYSHGEGWSQ